VTEWLNECSGLAIAVVMFDGYDDGDADWHMCMLSSVVFSAYMRLPVCMRVLIRPPVSVGNSLAEWCVIAEY